MPLQENQQCKLIHFLGYHFWLCLLLFVQDLHLFLLLYFHQLLHYLCSFLGLHFYFVTFSAALPSIISISIILASEFTLFIFKTCCCNFLIHIAQRYKIFSVILFTICRLGFFGKIVNYHISYGWSKFPAVWIVSKSTMSSHRWECILKTILIQ